MRLRTYIVDAFVVNGRPGTGNAAGVVLLPSVFSNADRDGEKSDDDDAGAAAAKREKAVASAKETFLDDASRQRLAAELRQTETAFVERKSKSDKSFLLRWFTPTTEVPLCGHATLAAAAALFEEGLVVPGEDDDDDEGEDDDDDDNGDGSGTRRPTATAASGPKPIVYTFETVWSGVLKVKVRFPPLPPSPPPSSSSVFRRPSFELDLPSRPPTDPLPRGCLSPSSHPPSSEAVFGPLLRALSRRREGGGTWSPLSAPTSAPLLKVRRIAYNADLGYLVLSLQVSEEHGASGGGERKTSMRRLIESLDPDPRCLRESMILSAGDVEEHAAASSDAAAASTVSAVIVTALDDEGDGDPTILSRFFAPWMGIDEDPATGSAHAVLAPLWAPELAEMRKKRQTPGEKLKGEEEEGSSHSFWPARQLSYRGGELSVCLLERKGRVLVRGGAAIALEGYSYA